MARMSGSYQKVRKAELHLHLEGSVEPATMRELNPSLTEEEVASRYRFSDFQGFIETYKWITGYLRTPEDYARITRRLLDLLRSDNIGYAEINVSVGVMLWRNQDARANFRAIREAAQGAAVEVRWIFDAVRQFGLEDGMRVAELAVEFAADGVVGFGIGGDEARGPAAWFREPFRFASDHGLRILPHAGETTGPESVWEAIEHGAARIGHGIRSVGDPALLRRLREDKIPLEICITSNLCTGAAASLREHPVREIFDAGVPIVLATDDPGIFNTTLSREYEIAERDFGFTPAELEEIAANSFRFALCGA